MKIENSYLNEVKIITPDIYFDERGNFSEVYKSSVFKNNGIRAKFVQDNEVRSKYGVLRGLHYQLKSPQGKLIRCILGTIIDVAVDIRIGSPTFGKHIKLELSADNKKMLYVPEGFAHGYLVTSKKSIVIYKCTTYYDENDQYGVIWNDKDLDINWNFETPALSKKDKTLPMLKINKHLPKY